MRRVPGYAVFPSVDVMHAELDAVAAAHPGLVRLRRVGTSRLGEPLRVLTVGDGPADAVVIGGPHPNEPVGTLTVSALIELLCEDAALRAELGHRWHFLPCADPDGARLNEGWYGRPGDRRAYVEHFYRPDLPDQVEWTFPLIDEDYHFDRTLPETAALMRLMDEVEPSLVCSLHNGEYQGAYFYLNRDDAPLAEQLAELPGLQGLPLHHGEPELPGSKPIAPAVHTTPNGAQVAAAFGAGGSSADYAARFGALHLVTEVPYWADARVSDRTGSGRTHQEIATAGATARRELIETLQAALRAVSDDLTVRSPFRRSTESTLETLRRLAERAEVPAGLDRPATLAEEFDSRQAVHLLRLRLLGVFLRMLDAEIAAGNPTPAIRAQHRLLTERFDRWFREAEAESPGPAIEIRRLVAVQLGAVLLAASRTAGGTATRQVAP
ncbi:M14 family zinc carboxypeptidase [Streptomyces sp. DG2A-72]|uniref:M14 family zinc carboxypeptidase n=1 Tax=Streptomyces sp. DG2A-72 TaxID=3051386 RepID=UPI00265C4A5D|nr:M14 family zinc carboxypeptidase [Streptomyces sp. DG2A-72]MDO0939066.1 M14 family zinc carboxypeptidase [Streptomyces sp. DG2A-72]